MVFVSLSLNVCRLHIFVFDSLSATLWESNCPFCFVLVMFPLGSTYFVAILIIYLFLLVDL